ncbi:MAG: 50S ribosomal protein L7/L12 [Pseudomonadota bacterium]
MSTAENLDLDKVVEQLSSLTVKQAADLSKRLEEAWGVSAAAPVAVAAAGAPAAGAEAAAEKTEFDVVLKKVDPSKKIQAIKAVRSVTDLDLKSAKGLVDEAPKAITTGVSKEEAEKIKAAFADSGAEIEIK